MGMKPVTSGPEGQAMCDLGSQIAAANLMPLHGTGQAYTGATLLWRTAGGLFRFDSVAGAPGEQANTGVPASPNVAIIVKKLTGQAGRQFRGRMYLMPPAAAVLDVGGATLTSNAVLTVQTKMDTFLTAPATGPADATFAWYLLHGHKKLPGDAPGFPTGPVPVPTFITGFSVESRVATQRGRLRD
jgi:hypothetical protein